MAKDLSKQNWPGIQRKEIPWFRAILEDQCIGSDVFRCHFQTTERY